MNASSKLILKRILPKIQKLYYSTYNSQEPNNNSNENDKHNIINNANFEKELQSNFNDNNINNSTSASEDFNINKNQNHVNTDSSRNKAKESKGVEYIRKIYRLNPAHYSYNKEQANNNYNNANTNQGYNNVFSFHSSKNKPIEVIIHETTSWRLFMKKCIVSVTAVLFAIICLLSFLEKQNTSGGM